MDLFSPVTDLRGDWAGAGGAALQQLGIFTLYDLLAYFPRDYEDRTNPVEIAQLQPGVPACFEAMVVSQPVLRRIGKGPRCDESYRRGRNREANAALFQSGLYQKPAALRPAVLFLRSTAGARHADGKSRL